MKAVIENFDRTAAEYESRAKPQAALASELAKWILPQERKGRALELGAGTGLFTRLMLPWEGIYLATDAAPKMVAIGREHCPNATWKTMDARTVADVGPMDWIFASSLLQWLPEPQVVLQSWEKILKPDGQLAFAVLLPGTLGELQSLLPEVRPVDWQTAEEWRAMLELAGFAIEREQVWEQQCIYPHSLDLLRAVHAMGLAPRQTVGPGRLRAALREYDRKHSTPNGVGATWRAWLVRARVTAQAAARP